MPEKIKLNTHKDFRGALTVLQDEIPFVTQRVFYIYDVPKDQVRGKHGHYKTRIFLLALSGEVSIRVIKYGKEECFTLNDRCEGLLLEPEDWHEMYNFSADSMLLVLASHPYDREDYFFEPLKAGPQ